MPDDLSVAVERLRTSTQRLNSVSDVASQVIRDVEAFLQECSVGIEHSVLILKVDETDEGKHFTTTHLAYQRYHGTFRIVIITVPFDARSAEDEIVRPWSEYSRDVKILAVSKLPNLLIELANAVEDQTKRAEQAVSGVASLLKNQKQKKGGA